MAFLLAAAALGGGALYYASKQDEEIRRLKSAVAEVEQYVPDSNTFNAHHRTVGLAHGGHVVRSIRDVDLHGVPRYLVDYGGGSWTQNYAPPNVINSAAQSHGAPPSY
jgi:hypothetical protein